MFVKKNRVYVCLIFSNRENKTYEEFCIKCSNFRVFQFFSIFFFIDSKKKKKICRYMPINISRRVNILPCIQNTNINIVLYLDIIKIKVEN